MPDDSPERVLHDALILLVEKNLTSLEASWRTQKKIQPFMLSWPQEPISDDEGEIIDNVVLMELPADKQERKKEVTELVFRTKPCALLLCEQLGDKVLVIFESPLGTKSWTYPLRKHGDVTVLGSKSSRENTESIGLLWSRN